VTLAEGDFTADAEIWLPGAAVTMTATLCNAGDVVVSNAVVAGAHKDYASARKAMTGLKPRVFNPNPKAHAVCQQLYPLYRKLHDALGTTEWAGNLSDAMKKLIEIRTAARNAWHRSGVRQTAALGCWLKIRA
jgi:ribulose kinase